MSDEELYRTLGRMEQRIINLDANFRSYETHHDKKHDLIDAELEKSRDERTKAKGNRTILAMLLMGVGWIANHAWNFFVHK